MRTREGDILRDLNGMLFDVKGLVHPPTKVVAFPRFIPDCRGNRRSRGATYRKVYSISERLKFLEQKFPHYLVHDHVFDEKLCEVPVENVKHYYNPITRLRELRRSEGLDALEIDALKFLELIKDYTNVPWSKIGISGSLLVRLHTPSSDIDPIIYGDKNCRKVNERLKTLTQNSKSIVKSYSIDEMRELFQFRVKDTQTSFEDFVRTESRKVLQGKFLQTDYFIRFVKDWSEVDENYGDIRYVDVGHARVKATVVDDSQSIFTPCVYRVSNVRVLEGSQTESVEEIASFRGRFSDQARIGEVVIAQGKVEHVLDDRQNREYFRLLLGNKPPDHMILA
jgi:predicted nucleotidyltransferase